MKSLIFFLAVVAMSSASETVNVVDNVDQAQVVVPPHDGGAITDPLDPAFSRPSATYPAVQYPSAGNGLYYPPPSYYDRAQVAVPPHDGEAITDPLDPAFSRPSATYPAVQYPSAGNGLYYPPPSYYDRGTVSGQDVPNVPIYQVKPPGWDKRYSFPGARSGSADTDNQ